MSTSNNILTTDFFFRAVKTKYTIGTIMLLNYLITFCTRNKILMIACSMTSKREKERGKGGSI